MTITANVCGVLSCLLIASCGTSSSDEASIGAQPNNYRQISAEHLQKTWLDPDSFKDAQIAPPKPGQVYIDGTLRREAGWIVCWRANLKNFLGYGEINDNIVVIRNDRVVASTDAPKGDIDLRQCADTKYEPFPELELASNRSASKP